MAERKRTFRAGVRRAMLTGLATMLPLLLTLFLLIWAYSLIDKKIGRPINSSIKKGLQTESGRYVLQNWFGWEEDVLNDDEKFESQLDKKFPNYFGLAIGILLAVGVVYVAGFLVATYVGRKAVRMAENLLVRFPVVKVVYPYAKQLTEFLFREKKDRFSAVVAVEYPRKGIFAVGFLTGDGLRDVNKATGEEMVTVFIPSSPTPITGYTILVPAKDVIQLSMKVDEAFRFAVSAGVIIPPGQLVTRALAKKPGKLPAEASPPERKAGDTKDGED